MRRYHRESVDLVLSLSFHCYFFPVLDIYNMDRKTSHRSIVLQMFTALHLVGKKKKKKKIGKTYLNDPILDLFKIIIIRKIVLKMYILTLEFIYF